MGKFSMNFLYTDPSSLRLVQKDIKRVLTWFDDWDKDLNVWVCSNFKEYLSSHEKILGSKDLAYKATTFRGKPKGICRLVYGSPEILNRYIRVGGLRTKYLSQPNLLVRVNEFKELNPEVGESILVHEFCHAYQIDKRYDEDITYAYEDALIPISILLPSFKKQVLCYSFSILHKAHDDISTNQIVIDRGFEKKLFQYFFSVKSKGYRQGVLQNRGKSTPLQWFYRGILPLVDAPVPFKIKGKKNYATKIERFLYNIFNLMDGIDGVGIARDLIRLLEKLENPPRYRDLIQTYEYVSDKIEELMS
jgi:hypothetical protein